jgi:Ca2+-binding RTX toxin-like protein
VNVTGLADVNGTSISLGGGTFNAGTLTYNSAGAVAISEDSSMDIVGVNTAGSADLDSTAGISDAGATSVNVTGLADVNGTSISLGGGTFNAGTLTYNSAGAVAISEDSSMDIVGVNTAGSADLDSTAGISDAGATSVNVTGLADVNGTSISLGGGTFNAGTLTFNSAGAVTISEDSDMNVVGSNSGTPTTLNSTDNLTIAGGASITSSGNITLHIDSDNNAGATLTVTPGAVLSTPVINGTFANGNGFNDIFNINAQATTEFFINGFAPTTFPGDVLNITVAPLATQAVTDLGSGYIDDIGMRRVNYVSIEKVNITGGPVNLTLDLTAVYNAAANQIRVSSVTPDLVLERLGTGLNTGEFFRGTQANINSLTILGGTLADDVTVVDNGTGGLPDFVGTIPTAFNNPLVTGTPEFLFQGGLGTDSLTFNLTQSGTSQRYGFGSGAVAPVLTEGEVVTANGSNTLVAYFTGMGAGENVNRIGTGGSPGTLTIIGDNTANTINTSASATTTINPAGYSPFTINPGTAAAYSGITFDALNAGDAYNFTGTAALGLDNLAAPVTVADSGLAGVDVLNVNDANDASGDAISVTQAAIEGIGVAAGNDYSYSGIETLDVTGTGGADTITSSFIGGTPLATVNVRGNADNDTFFLSVADGLTTLATLNLIGDDGNDTFGSASSKINPVLAGGGGVTNVRVFGGTTSNLLNPNTTNGANDKLFLDMTNTSAGATVNPLVIVDTTTGQAQSANTRLFRFDAIEDIDLYDGGQLTNVSIGDLYVRGTTAAENYVFYRGYYGPNDVLLKINTTLINPNLQSPYLPVNAIVVYSRDGNDSIDYNFTLGSQVHVEFHGEGGDDILNGGPLNDILVGGGGNDTLQGFQGNDILWGDDQAITGWAERQTGVNPLLLPATVAGNDRLFGGTGDDFVFGGGGNDSLEGNGGSDYLHGGNGDDAIVQTGGDRSILRGEAGNDILTSGSGNDILIGGIGNDRLTGAAGRDFMLAGSGADFLFDNTSDSGEDVLVSGGTALDDDTSTAATPLWQLGANDASLQTLLTGWLVGAPFAGRIGAITSSAIRTTATNDSAVDMILGSTLAPDYVIRSANDTGLLLGSGDQLETA